MRAVMACACLLQAPVTLSVMPPLRYQSSYLMDFLPALPLQVSTLFFFGLLLFCGALGGYL
ncbi:MAG: hypothetical protein WAQ19_09300, partial [Burkholderiaceae bacterium]